MSVAADESLRWATFASLRTRNFRLFFVGQLISNTGNWLTNLAMTLLVLHLTNSGIAVGILTSCQYGPMLILSAWAGTFADRTDKRRALFVTQSLEMGQSGVLAVMAFSPRPSVGLLYAIAVVGGILLAFDNPLRRSFVTEMVSHDDLPNAVSLYSSLVNISRVFGPALAGVLVVTVGFGWCFVIDAVSYVFVLGALKMMRTSELRRTTPAPRRRGQVRQAIRYTWAIPDLRTTFVMLGIVCVLGYNLNVVFPLVVERSLGGGDGAFTLLYVCFSVGAVIASLAVARRPAVSVMRIVVGCAAYGVTMLGLAVAPNLGVAFAVAVLIGASSILYTTTTTAIVQTRADPRMHGRLLSLQVILLVGFAPINGPFLGYLADLVGPRSPAALGGVAALLAAAWGWTHLA